MQIPDQDLQAAGSDIAAVIGEDFLNAFSAAHFRNVPGIYTGSQKVTNLANDIEIDYSFTTPIVFDLAPIPTARFKSLWLSHLRAKGAPSLELEQIVGPPENVLLHATSVHFTIKCFDGHTPNVVLTAEFDWDLSARCAVTLNGSVLTLEPIKIEFTDSQTAVKDAIAEAVTLSADSGGHHRRWKPGDPQWCIEAEELLLFIINTVLAGQMANFVRSWGLPNAIALFDGITVSPNFMSVKNNSLTVGAKVGVSLVGPSPIQAEIDYVVTEYSKRLEAELQLADDDFIREWTPERSGALAWLQEYANSTEKHIEEQAAIYSDITRFTGNESLALCSDSQLVDLLAKKYLSVNQQGGDSASIDHLLKADVGWWVKVENASGSIVAGGIDIRASISIGGSLSICHFNLDPKHFGSWACSGLSVQLKPFPDPPGFDVDAFPSFRADGIYLSARLNTQSIALNVPGWPGWANDILGWVTGALTWPLLAVIRLVISKLTFRIAKYPKFFPGTGLNWTANMDTTPTNAGRYLVFQAAPTFP